MGRLMWAERWIFGSRMERALGRPALLGSARRDALPPQRQMTRSKYPREKITFFLQFDT